MNNKGICKFEKVLKLDPKKKNVLDYFRAHKGEIKLERCIKELKMLLRKVISWQKLKRLGERNEK